jgi:hypothetical protein
MEVGVGKENGPNTKNKLKKKQKQKKVNCGTTLVNGG